MLRTLRTLTLTLEATSAERNLLISSPIYPCAVDVPTTSTAKRMGPVALREYALPYPNDLHPVPPSFWGNSTPV